MDIEFVLSAPVENYGNSTVADVVVPDADTPSMTSQAAG